VAQQLEIPNPRGFAVVTPRMATVYEFQKQFVAPTNEQFIAFIPESAVPLALKNEIPDLTRTFAAQTAKTLVSASVSSSDFLKLKQMIKNQNEELMKKVEKDVPGLMGKINQGITKKYDIDLAFSLSQMVPLPPHHETDRLLAYSSFVKYNMNDASGNPASYVAVLTATFVHVKSKVLFLYSSGLEWSRELSKQWADAVVAANPSDLQSSIKESLPSAVTGIDWSKVGAKAVAGAFIGLIVWLIVWLIGWARSRGKSS
jgi:hypothetical protein